MCLRDHKDKFSRCCCLAYTCDTNVWHPHQKHGVPDEEFPKRQLVSDGGVTFCRRIFEQPHGNLIGSNSLTRKSGAKCEFVGRGGLASCRPLAASFVEHRQDTGSVTNLSAYHQLIVLKWEPCQLSRVIKSVNHTPDVSLTSHFWAWLTGPLYNHTIHYLLINTPNLLVLLV